MRCPPGCHDYKPYGKILFCRKCGDVQPLLLAEEYDEQAQAEPIERPRAQSVPRGIEEPEAESPSIEELEHTANLLRRAVGLRRDPGAEQLDLGVRHAVDDDELVDLSNRQTTPRVGVNEGFEGSPYDEDLPSPGL